MPCGGEFKEVEEASSNNSIQGYQWRHCLTEVRSFFAITYLRQIQVAYSTWSYAYFTSSQLRLVDWRHCITGVAVLLYLICACQTIQRVSHNQGYHLVCTWGQKSKFIYGPKNNWTWKSIDYSV